MIFYILASQWWYCMVAFIVREHAGQAFVEGSSCWAKATCDSEDQRVKEEKCSVGIALYVYLH